MNIAAAFRDELAKLADSPTAVVSGPAKPGFFRKLPGRIGRAALVAAPIGVAAYGLGRGLKRGERDKEQAAHADAVRSARLSGSPY